MRLRDTTLFFAAALLAVPLTPLLSGDGDVAEAATPVRDPSWDGPGAPWGAAWATSGIDPDLGSADADGDGEVTRAEWSAADRSFENHDWNGDGVLTEAEMARGRTRLGDDAAGIGRFLTLDADGNGVLVPREWPGGSATFRRLDANGDGVIMKAEMAGVAPSPDRTAWLEDWDADLSGSLGLDEWPSDAAAFNRLDRDLDGELAPAELLQG